jgi:aspartate ammonia-lyase
MAPAIHVSTAQLTPWWAPTTFGGDLVVSDNDIPAEATDNGPITADSEGLPSSPYVVSTAQTMLFEVTEMFRLERDLLGEREVPTDVYWGIHTLRARENFQISREQIGDAGELVAALASVKAACARANQELGRLDGERADAIVAACEEIRGGLLHKQFVVDLIQGGAGTSTNMNANEVIANRALELLGRERGDYGYLHPNEHVNMSQSTNDVYPTAVRLALISMATRLSDAIRMLASAFGVKAEEFSAIVKIGRTQLQDAVPMTVGQELGAYRSTLLEDVDRLLEVTMLLREVNLGATAIGTGITAPSGYAQCVTAHLSKLTRLPLVVAPDLVEATQDTGVFVTLSGILKRLATKLIKICNDLRLLSSGPRGGLGELQLPAMQAGSSIMPGKVNPVIPEVVNEIAFAVIGHDAVVTLAAQAGQLQLNPFEPIMFRSLRESLDYLTAGCTVLAQRCVQGIRVNHDQLARRTEGSVALCTVLAPQIGYSAASLLAQEALSGDRSVPDLVLEHGLMDEAELAEVILRLQSPHAPVAVLPGNGGS